MDNTDSKDQELSKENEAPPESAGVSEAAQPSGPIDNSGFLDLGLGTFLKAHSAISWPSQVVSSNEGSQPAGLIPEPLQPEEKKEPALTEFEQLEQLQDWTKILQKSESILEDQKARHSSSNQWIEAQAWWLIAQVKINSLPAAVLSAPTEAMLEQVMARIGSATSSELSEEHKYISTLVKKSAAQLATKYFSIGEMETGMQLLSRTRVLGGDLSALTQIVEQFREQLNGLSSSQQRLFVILQKELGIVAKDLPKKSEQDIQNVSEDLVKKANHKISSISSNSKQRPFYFYVLIVFILLLLILASLFYFLGKSTEIEEFPYQTKEIEIPNPDLQLPKPEPVSKISELDAVLYGLGEKEQNSNINSTNEQPSQVAPIARTPKPKEELDTQGPLESEKLRDLREKSQQPNVAERREPNVVVPGPAIAPRFETFPNPRIYRIRRATNLMLKPSLNTDAVAGLNRGDRVNVVGMAGYWLKVLSRQGRIAYVLAEDAELE